MKKFLLWNGRMGRYQFFACSFLGGLGIGIIIAILGSILGPSLTSIIGLLLALFLLYLNTCWAMQRLHDLDKPAWLAIFYSVPLELNRGASSPDTFTLVVLAILAFSTIYLLFIKGTEGPNQYGPDPIVTKFAPPEETEEDA